MLGFRLFILPVLTLFICLAVLFQWHWSFGFDALDPAWWSWLLQVIVLQLTSLGRGGVPWEVVGPVFWTLPSAYS